MYLFQGPVDDAQQTLAADLMRLCGKPSDQLVTSIPQDRVDGQEECGYPNCGRDEKDQYRGASTQIRSSHVQGLVGQANIHHCTTENPLPQPAKNHVKG